MNQLLLGDRPPTKAYVPPKHWTRLVSADGVVLGSVPDASAADDVAARWARIGLVVEVRKPGGAR